MARESPLIGWYDLRVVVCFCQVRATEEGKVRMESCVMLYQETNIRTSIQRMYRQVSFFSENRRLIRIMEQSVKYH